MTAAKTQGRESLLEDFRNTVPYRPECGNCGEKFFRKEIENALEEAGAFEQVKKASELAFTECPECGAIQDFGGVQQ
ncbi:MAG: hypothetical protein ABEJ95_06165 [Candidatus Nanohalobium sp.]